MTNDNYTIHNPEKRRRLTLAAKLSDARRNHKIFYDKTLTQEKMAKLLNVSKSTYSRWENGKTSIPLCYLQQICVILNKAPNYFYVD